LSKPSRRVKANASMLKNTCVRFWDARERGGWFAKGGRRGLSDNVAALLLGRLSCSEYPACVNIISFCGLLI